MSCSVKSVLARANRATVSVNGVVIPDDLVSREVQHHPAPTPVAAWTEAARTLVVRELLLQEARRKGLSPEPPRDEKGRREPDEEALIRALVEQEIVTPEPDEETCRRYYEQSRARFRSRDLFEASHILLAAHPGDAAARDAARRAAAGLIAQLQQGSDVLGQPAEAYSAGPSGKSGGNLGQMGPGETTPEFEKALYRFAPAEMTKEPVETRYGFHIIRLDRRIDGRPGWNRPQRMKVAILPAPCGPRSAVSSRRRTTRLGSPSWGDSEELMIRPRRV